MKVKPIKSIEKLEQFKNELEKFDSKGENADKTLYEKKRNRALFCTGINTALRVSDIITLDLIDVFNIDLTFKEEILLKEQKTRKEKGFAVTNTLKEELKEYLCWYFAIIYNINIRDDKSKEEHREEIREIIEKQPLFLSERRVKELDGEKIENKYLSRVQVYRILNEVAEKLGLERVGSHTMRKTFGYWFYKRTKDIAMLQKMLNHSSIRETLIYIDVEQDEINNAYKNFGL